MFSQTLSSASPAPEPRNTHSRSAPLISRPILTLLLLLLHAAAYPFVLVLVRLVDGVHGVEQLLDGTGDVSVEDTAK